MIPRRNGLYHKCLRGDMIIGEMAASDQTSEALPGPWPAGVGPALVDGAPFPPDSTVPFRSVGFTLSTTGYAVASRFRELLAPLGLEPREFALLRVVAAAEGHSQQAIGERLRIPPSRM